MDPSTTTLTGTDGARLTVTPHGGQVLGWRPAGGPARLWLSPLARIGPGEAARGGVPVVFPQFAGRGPLPKHGFARDRPWQVLASGPASGTAGAASWTAGLSDDAGTRAVWPHRFRLQLSARAEGGRLRVELAVTNTGDQPWTFSAALHTYLAVGDPGTTLLGLGGQPAEQNAAPGSFAPVPAGPLAALRPQDVSVYPSDPTGPVLVQDAVLGPLRATAGGFGQWVVWNPGAANRPDDVPPGGELGYCCLEPALLEAVQLAPGAGWTGYLQLESGPLDG